MFPFYEKVRSKVNLSRAVSNDITKVRKLGDSLYTPEQLIFAIAVTVLGSLFGITVVLLDIQERDNMIPKCFILVASVVGLLFVFIALYSIRRAHTSKICDTVARFFVDEENIIPMIRELNDLEYHVQKNRSILFEYKEQRYLCFPHSNQYEDSCKYFNVGETECELFRIFDYDKSKREKIFGGPFNEILKYEFEAEKSMLNAFCDFVFLSIYKED